MESLQVSEMWIIGHRMRGENIDADIVLVILI